MARLTVSTVIAARVEELYRYVTGYGPDGHIDEERFREQYGTVEERDGNVFVVKEDVRRYPEDEPELVTWRCTFDYPSSRTMEALDSTWANRRDTFQAGGAGTTWWVRWGTRIGGRRALAQHLAFRLVGRRRTHRELFDPVKRHFGAGDGGEPSEAGV